LFLVTVHSSIGSGIITILFLYQHKTHGNLVNNHIHHQLQQQLSANTCNVIERVTTSDYPSNKIGEQTWPNGCPSGRYITAVWAALKTEHFEKIKCCDGAGDNSLSWELRDLALFSGGPANVADQWNIQCQTNAVISGIIFY